MTNYNEILDYEVTEEEEAQLNDYYLDELPNLFEEVCDEAREELSDYDRSEYLATVTTLTLRLSTFPVTPEEVAYDFDAELEPVVDGIEVVRKRMEIDRVLEERSVKEHLEHLCRITDVTDDVPRIALGLQKELVPVDEEDEETRVEEGEELDEDTVNAREELDEYDSLTVASTLYWVGTQVSAGDDGIRFKDIQDAILFVDSDDIKECYFDALYSNNYRVKAEAMDDRGIAQHIDVICDEKGLSDETRMKAIMHAPDFANYSYNNKALAALAVFLVDDSVTIPDVSISCNTATVHRIGQKLDLI